MSKLDSELDDLHCDESLEDLEDVDELEVTGSSLEYYSTVDSEYSLVVEKLRLLARFLQMAIMIPATGYWILNSEYNEGMQEFSQQLFNVVDGATFSADMLDEYAKHGKNQKKIFFGDMLLSLLDGDHECSQHFFESNPEVLTFLNENLHRLMPIAAAWREREENQEADLQRILHDDSGDDGMANNEEGREEKMQEEKSDEGGSRKRKPLLTDFFEDTNKHRRLELNHDSAEPTMSLNHRVMVATI